MPDCSLCRSDLEPILGESTYWRLVLNTNQNLLGKCFLVLRRHVETITTLSAAEWSALQPEILRATHMLEAAFQPDHFDYAFLQNEDRHVHLHIFPRYAAERRFEGLTFRDPEYPSHYDPSHVQRLLEAPPHSLGRAFEHRLKGILIQGRRMASLRSPSQMTSDQVAPSTLIAQTSTPS